MRKHNIKIRTALTTLALAASSLVAAGGGGGMTGGATEVTQLLNRTELAIQTVRQQAQYALQLEQKYRELLQLAPAELLSFGKTVQDIQESYQAYQRLSRASEDLYGSLENMQGLARQRFTEFSATGLTWEEYVQRNRQRNEQQFGSTQVLRAAEANAMHQVERNYQNIQAVSSEVSRSQGIHASTMQLNAQMTQLLTQMNQIHEFEVTQSKHRTKLDETAIADRERADKIQAEQNERYRRGDAQDQAIRDHLRGR